MAEFGSFLPQFSDDSVDENGDSADFEREFASYPAKRETCGRCRRPVAACVCGDFPAEPVKINTRVIILQHKDEIRRSLATVPLLVECIDKERLHVYRGRGKKINHERGEYSVLSRALQCPNTLLLYPGQSAVDLHTLPQVPIGHHDNSAILVLDGTWAQAKSMFTQNTYLHQVKQISLSSSTVSEYVIRTQPTNNCLSTLESVAQILAWVEKRPDIVEILARPLRALCQYQLNHGAVVHVSKEHPSYVPREELIRNRKEERKLKDQT